MLGHQNKIKLYFKYISITFLVIMIFFSFQMVFVFTDFQLKYLFMPIFVSIVFGTLISELISYKYTLDNNQKLLDTILEYDNSGVGIIDLSGNFTFASSVLCKILAFQKNEILGINCNDITVEAYKNANLEAIAESIKYGYFRKLKQECYKKDGSKIFIEISMTLLNDKKQIVLLVNNLQYEKELEILNSSLELRVKAKTKELKELNNNLENKVKEEVEKNRDKDMIMFQQARLASMGEMIGNIAHQWRQPLSAIIALIQNIELRRKLGRLDDEFIQDKTSQALAITKQMSSTIDDFRNFFSKTKQKEIFCISKVFEENLHFIQDTLKANNIEVIKNIKSINSIFGYKNEVSHSFLNILNNAKDVLIDNNLGNVKRLIFVNINDTNYGIDIEIIDNGGGIKDEVIEKIFDPYFTTKHQSHGTGIGLYMTKQIIEKNMQGSIDVENYEYEYDGLKYIGAKFLIKFKKKS